MRKVAIRRGLGFQSWVKLMNIRSKISALVIDKEELAPTFTNYLMERDLLDPTKLKSLRFDKPLDSTSLLKQLWRSTNLSSHEFANEE
jgi:hypothetical protein